MMKDETQMRRGYGVKRLWGQGQEVMGDPYFYFTLAHFSHLNRFNELSFRSLPSIDLLFPSSGFFRSRFSEGRR